LDNEKVYGLMASRQVPEERHKLGGERILQRRFTECWQVFPEKVRKFEDAWTRVKLGEICVGDAQRSG